MSVCRKLPDGTIQKIAGHTILLDANASEVREGTWSLTGGPGSISTNITFTDPMPDTDYVVVIEPNGLQQIIKNVGRENVFVVYLTYPDKDRLIRSLVARNDKDVDEVIRRFQADKNDMQGMEWVADVTIVNHDSTKTAELIYKMVK